MPPTTGDSPSGAGELRCRAGVRRGRVCVRPRDRHAADELPDQPRHARLRAVAAASRPPRSRRPTASTTRSEETSVPQHTFMLNGEQVTVEVADDVRLLWVLRDILGVTGPKYGCGLDVCKSCTSHINGKAFNPCSVPVSKIEADRRDHHHRGPAGHRRPRPAPDAGGLAGGRRRAVRLLPARPDHGGRRARCGRSAAEGRDITDADLDELRNICRCGTYTRIREAIKAGAEDMGA